MVGVGSRGNGFSYILNHFILTKKNLNLKVGGFVNTSKRVLTRDKDNVLGRLKNHGNTLKT